MKLIRKINRNNFTCKRIRIELTKILIDNGIIKGQNNYQKFVILARSRVGSNLLISYLNTHPEVFAAGEMFGNNHSEEIICYRKKNPGEYLKKYCYRRYDKSIKAVGFKIFYYHPVKDEPRTIWKILKETEGLKVIHLKRKNILRTHVSKVIASNTDKWTVTGNAQIPISERAVELNYEECVEAFRQTTEWERHFDEYFTEKSNNQYKIEIIYEDLISNPHEELERVLEFLNLPLYKLTSSLKRQNPEPLNRLVSNYQELKQKFADTEWSCFFED